MTMCRLDVNLPDTTDIPANAKKKITLCLNLGALASFLRSFGEYRMFYSVSSNCTKFTTHRQILTECVWKTPAVTNEDCIQTGTYGTGRTCTHLVFRKQALTDYFFLFSANLI